jgi:plastocyanin
VRRLATIAGALVFCALCALGAPAAGAQAPPEYVAVAVSRPTLEYVNVALPAHMTARRGAAHHARACKRRARDGRRAANKAVAAHTRGRGQRHARHCRRRHSAPHAPGRTSPAANPTAGALTGAGTTGSTLAGGPGSPSSGSSPSQTPSAPVPPAVPRVQVTATEYSYTMSRTSVPAGRVIVEFVNRGQDEHNLKLTEREGELAGSFQNTLSGGVADQSLILRAGTYTLFCSLPEHESKGMRATLLVQ